MLLVTVLRNSYESKTPQHTSTDAAITIEALSQRRCYLHVGSR